MPRDQTEFSFGILIRTYYKDVERLRYCLKSIRKYCVGINEITVVCPEKSIEKIFQVTQEFTGINLKSCPDYENDYVGQQITKLLSHLYCESNFILHIDSDCHFIKEFNPIYYFEDGLPLLYHREYDYFYRAGVLMPWQFVTSHFIGRQVDFEFMALFPLVYPRRIYEDIEKWYKDKYNSDYNSIFGKLSGPTLFSEFNLMGAFSYYMAPEGRPYHKHVNWGVSSPEHYLIQGCLDGSPDRSIKEEELQAIEAAIS